MKILVLNCGSSTVKCQLYEFQQLPDDPMLPLWEGQLEWKSSSDDINLKVTSYNGASVTQKLRKKSPDSAIKTMIEYLQNGSTAVISSFDEIDMIGHRIVHGGKEFQESVFINQIVKDKIHELSELAPLHNPAGLVGIEIMEKLFPNKPQMAVFDTAFHHTLSDAAKIYPLPYKRYEEGIQRFGFHGISFQYCYSRAEKVLNEKLSHAKILICHLGSGASLCAIKNGKSIDTTMGFAPLEGLMMDTRSGSVDPSILLYLMMKKNRTAEELYTELYKKSGLLGISDISSDMRDILELAHAGNERAELTLNIYLHRLNACIGSMSASLQGIDLLIFTAGIGENSPFIRKKVCDNFSFLNIKLNDNLNSKEDTVLSADNSKVRVLLIHTQEAFQIAKDCWQKSR